eukprot:1458806-Rhodomonas_salina.2
MVPAPRCTRQLPPAREGGRECQATRHTSRLSSPSSWGLGTITGVCSPQQQQRASDLAVHAIRERGPQFVPQRVVLRAHL